MNGRVLSCTTVQHVTNLESQTSENKARTDEFHRVISERRSAVDYFIQIHGEGNCQVLFDEIKLCRTYGKEIKQQDATVVTSQGTNKRRQGESKIRWELLVQWKDKSTTWITLKDTKESYPVQVAEYAVEAILPKSLPLRGGCPTHYESARGSSQSSN